MTAVPTTLTAVAGAVLTASQWNANNRDVENWLLAPALLQIRATSTQALANNTQTAILFDTEDVDSTGMHSTSSNTSRATAVYPGWYQFNGGIPIASNATGRRGYRFNSNGSAVIPGSAVMTPPVNGNPTQIPGRTILIFMNVGDYIEAQGYQDSGGSLNTTATAPDQPSMTARWVSN